MFDLEKTINKLKKEIFDYLKEEKDNPYYPFEAAHALFYLEKVLDEYYSSLNLDDKSNDFIVTGKEV